MLSKYFLTLLLHNCYQIGLVQDSFKLVPPHGFLPAADQDLVLDAEAGHD